MTRLDLTFRELSVEQHNAGFAGDREHVVLVFTSARGTTRKVRITERQLAFLAAQATNALCTRYLARLTSSQVAP